jgi:hypothetical protein
MKFLTICFLFCGFAHATSYAPLDFPAEPIPTQLLEKNGLAGAGEETLIRYIQANWDAAGYWIPNVTDREQKTISSEFFKRAESKDGEAEAYLKSARAQLQIDRLADPRRIVDATIRVLGRTGTGKSLPALLAFPTTEEREWVCWKVLATVQEILTRVDPTKLDDRTLMNISADLVAPLLRDLDSEVAKVWAWTLWEHHKEWLRVSFRSKVRLRTRLWLARAFAADHPQQALEVFQEGLQSQDATIRTAAEMIIRSGIGGSHPYDTSSERLTEVFLATKWNLPSRHWEALPLPLDRPLIRTLSGGQTDLIWLSNEAKVTKSIEDVWPLIREPLTKGNFYTRVGDVYPLEYGLSDSDGKITSRFRGLSTTPVIASHGGLWALYGKGRMVEFHADGSILWECPVDSGYRKIVPISSGRVVLLGYKFIECRNRRGDLLWKTMLTSLDDPRDIVPVEEDRFLISCGKSVGWLTRDGKYDPLLSNLISPGWVRYHPSEPWIIKEGGDTSVIIYDPKTKKEMGRVDLDDGWGSGKSRFPFPATYFPE